MIIPIVMGGIGWIVGTTISDIRNYINGKETSPLWRIGLVIAIIGAII